MLAHGGIGVLFCILFIAAHVCLNYAVQKFQYLLPTLSSFIIPYD